MCDIYKNLGLWDNLKGISENTGHLQLQIETAWNQKDFPRLSNLLTSAYFENSSFYYLCHCLNNLNNPNSRNEDIQKGFLYIIKEWTIFPKKTFTAHRNLLFKIQQLVEIDESNNILIKIKEGIVMNNSSQDVIENIFHEINLILNMWRERMPKKNEDITDWTDILDQRNFVNKILISRLKKGLHQAIINRTDDSEYEKLGCFDDTLWNTLKFAQIERNYGYFKTISKLYKEENKIENVVKLNPNQPSLSPNANQELYLKTKEFVYFFLMFFLLIKIDDLSNREES